MSFSKALYLLLTHCHQVVRELCIFIFPTLPTIALYTVGAQASLAKLNFWKVNMEKGLQVCCLKIDSYTWAGKWICRAQSNLPKRWLIRRLPHYFFSSFFISFIVSVTELIKTQPSSNLWLQNIASCTHTYLFQSIYVSPAWLRRGCYTCALHLIF